jgi:hemoglobin
LTDSSFYDEVGGTGIFVRLVDHFYAGVATDPVLSAMYTPADIAEEFAGARRRMTTFLVQYFGGPRTYADERGHPRLRMRHAQWAIDEDARDRWLRHAISAVRELRLQPRHEAVLTGYLQRAADALQNQRPA